MTNIDKVIDQINQHLSELDGLEVKFQILKNDQFGFKFVVDAVKIEKLKDLEKQNERLSKSYGFTQNIVGMEFEYKDRDGSVNTHKITGFKPRNRKYPIITMDITRQLSYKFSVSSVKDKLGGDRMINRFANLEKLV